jgi:D-alanyl-D-alanine carboxypeptidase (penicillin-binding protein 5/6)
MNFFKKAIALFLILGFITGCVPIESPDMPTILWNQGSVGDDDSVVPLEIEPDSNGRTETSAPTLVPAPENARPPAETLHSGGIFMYNFETDTVVFARNEHERFPPASIAKILTLLVVLENVDDLSKIVQVTEAAFEPFDSGDPNFEDAAIARIEVGQTNVTYLDALYGLMLPSGCEAANILAYNVGGGCMDTFVQMMNNKAREIGALNSNFTNASGLYEYNYYSTAYDMFLISKYTLEKYPLFMEISASPTWRMPPNSDHPDGYNIRNTSAGLLLIHELDYTIGIKIGSIFEVFRGGIRFDGFTTLVSMAQKNGLTFMTVSLDADYYDEEGRWSGWHYEDHAVLYEWAYGQFTIDN